MRADAGIGERAFAPRAHRHARPPRGVAAMRGWLEDLPFRKWIIRLTKARQDILTPDRLLSSARLGIAEGLLAGITPYAGPCGSGPVPQALREMRVRGTMYLEVFGPQPEQAAASLKTLGDRVAS